MNKIENIAYKKGLFFFIWIGIMLLYFPAYKAGFFMDFYGTLKHFQNFNFIDFVNRKGIENQSLYQFTQILLYVLISVFGNNPIPWFLLFTTFHVFTGFLIFRFLAAFLEMMGWKEARNIALLSVVLFLISPIAAEVVIWKASFHYHTAITIMFLILNLTLNFIKTERNSNLWLIWILYFLSSYMLELFYLTPAFVLFSLCALRFSKNINHHIFKKSVFNIFIPLVIIWCLYLITYNFIYGKWIAHYEFDLGSAFTLGNAISKLLMYIIHIFSMESFLPMDKRLKIFDFTQKSFVIIIIAITLMAVTVYGIWKYKFLNPKKQVLFFIFISSLTSCVLIIPMWFNTLTMIANDRYYYLPSVFFFTLFVVAVLYGKKYKMIRYGFIIAYMLICLIATSSIVSMYKDSAKIQNGLMENFKWQEADTVLFLNLPNNYNGIYLFPADTLNAFNGHLKVFGYDSIKSKTYEVSSYNVQSFWDGAHVTVQDSLKLKVTPNQYGCWWWYRTLGATDYENELYQFTLTDNGFSYLLEFKQKPSDGTVILIQQGDQWKEVDMTKINEEQW